MGRMILSRLEDIEGKKGSDLQDVHGHKDNSLHYREMGLGSGYADCMC